MSNVPTAEQLAHDTAMLEALKDVVFGHFNQSKQFIQGIRADGVKTARQRWWLTTLVVRHRKQLKPQFHGTLARAEKWLRDNQEPTTSSRSTGAAQQQGPVHPGPPLTPADGTPRVPHPDDRTAPSKATDPDLFP